MRIPPPPTETTLRLPEAGGRLPPLTLGQRLEVLVEGRRPEGLLLNVLGRRMAVPSPLQAERGQRLTVQVQALQPRVALKILATEYRAADSARMLLARLLPRQQGPVSQPVAGITRGVESGQAEALPANVREALGRIAPALPTAAAAGDPQRLRQVLERSGIFLERLLARLPGRDAATMAGRDLKAVLHRAAAALRQSLGQAGGTVAPHSPAASAGAHLAPVMEGLLAQVESALARIQLLQLQPNISQSPLDLTVEVPLRDGTDIDNLYLRIRREDGGGAAAEQGQSGEPVFSLVVRLDFEHLGFAQATLRLQGERVSAVWHCENPALSEAVQQHLPELKARLRALGLETESMLCVSGSPPASTDDIRQPATGILHEQA